MKQHLTPSRLVLALALIASGICISSFRGGDSTRQKTFPRETFRTTDDTTKPGKRNRGDNEIRVNDLDNALRHLDEQMVKLDEQIKKLDFSKMERELSAAMSNVHKVDGDKIAKEVQASLAKVDWSKIEMKLQDARKHMSETDWKKMDVEMKEAARKMKEVDVAKIKQDIEQSKAEKIKLNIDTGKIRRDVSKAMEKAKVSIEKAQQDIKNMQEFTNELHSNGLINKNKPYTIEVKDNELYINDTLQSKEVTEKYRKYFRKGNFKITNGKNATSI